MFHVWTLTLLALATPLALYGNFDGSFKDIKITFDFDLLPGTRIGEATTATNFAGFQPFASANNPDIPSGFGFTVKVSGTGIATLYDSTNIGGLDPDLEGGLDGTNWKGGNGSASGGIAFIQGESVIPVPEVGSFGLFIGLCSMACALRRRR